MHDKIRSFLTFNNHWFWLSLVVFLFLFTISGVRAEDRIFTLQVTGAEAQMIGDALGTQPFSKVAPLMNKLQQQVIAQQQKATEVSPKKEPTK